MAWNWLKEKSKKIGASARTLKTSHSFLPEVQIYIESELKKRFGLFNIIPLEGHYQNGIAHTNEGKVFINFFSSQNSHFFQRSLFTHSLLKKHDIIVPELLWADANPQNLQKYRVCCFVTRWISGRSLLECSQESYPEAFRIMGKIHTITLEHQKMNQPHFGKSCPLPILSGQELAEKLPSILKNPLTKEVVPLEDAIRAFSFLESGLTAAYSSLNSPVLLHRDFHPGNLLLQPDKTLVTLDFETSAFGPFFLDLSNSLIKFYHKSRSSTLDDVDLEELVYSSELQILSWAYFSAAPQLAKELWESSGSFFLFVVYMKIICQLTKRSSFSSKHAHAAEQTKVQLHKRWKTALKYVHRHDNQPPPSFL